MLEFSPALTDEAESEHGRLETTIRYLLQRSLELREYSRRLKEQSHEINRRVQSQLNTKRAA